MKFLADFLLAMAPTRSDELERARLALRMPAVNHAVCDPADIHRGMCDRFVFSKDCTDALLPLFGDVASMEFAVGQARAPLPLCWIECVCSKDALPTAIFVDGDEAMLFTLDRKLRVVVPLFAYRLSEIGCDPVYAAPLCCSDTKFLTLGADLICIMLAALGSHRIVTQSRSAPSVATPAERALLRRRLQIGRPIFSYNRVDAVFPKTSLHRGAVRQIVARNGQRGHWRIAHWRLIDGVLEPYWTWVQGVYCGELSFGAIVKAREVGLRPGDLRRGFRFPAFAGAVGQRVAAVRA